MHDAVTGIEGEAQSSRYACTRREFLAAGMALAAGAAVAGAAAPPRPNLLYVFADQWRGQATGYAGDPNARTPNLDRLAGESLNLINTVAVCPVCSPYRASLLTGRYPLSHGVFLNDVPLDPQANSIGDVFLNKGYETGYIGKWHLNGSSDGAYGGRAAFIPPERRQGFSFWRVLECTHNYNRSDYYGDGPEKKQWDGYDAVAQTREAERFIREKTAAGKPFCLFLSWGPPHDPYNTAPEPFRKAYADADIAMRPNVPVESAAQADRELRGYYAHIAALDECVGSLVKTLRETGADRDTILVFTSDHGDMLGSQGFSRKHVPWDESAVVPFLLRYPRISGPGGRTVDLPVTTPDIMPTLLGLAGIEVPDSVEGTDFSATLRGEPGAPDSDGALFQMPVPFGMAARRDIPEYRAIRTRRHTYVETREGPWLLYDNREDPYQRKNLAGLPETADLQRELAAILKRRLRETGDEFLPAAAYVATWNYHHMRELGGRYPAPGQAAATPAQTDETGWFSAVQRCRATREGKDCRIEALEGAGAAWIDLEKPATGRVIIRVRYRTVAADNPKNAFVALASGRADNRQVWCGTFLGVGKHATFVGPCKGTEADRETRSGSAPDAEITAEIAVDVRARTARLKANGDVLEFPLPDSFDALRRVGCAVFRTASAFSRPEIVVEPE